METQTYKVVEFITREILADHLTLEEACAVQDEYNERMMDDLACEIYEG